MRIIGADVRTADIHIYRSLAKKGPWVVHLTVGSNRGGWADIAGINTGHYKHAKQCK